MRRFYCESLPAELGEPFDLNAEASHHVLRVVGIAPDEHFDVFDGKKAMTVVIRTVSKGVATCIGVAWPVRRVASAEIWLLLGVLRPGPMSIALRMATELGVARILPICCQRSVARGDKHKRWESILQSSAAQCGRVSLPQLERLMSPAEGLVASREIENRYVLSPSAGHRLVSVERAALWVGPEGGLSSEEINLAESSGWRSASLGQFTLRADTAVAAALSQMI